MPRLVLLPGLHGTDELFTPFIAAAADGWDCVAVTLPPIAAYDELALRIEPLIAEQGRCFVLAESFSGPLGLRLAARLSNVEGLIFCNSFVASPRFKPLRMLAVAPLFAIRRPKFAIRLVLAGADAESQLVDQIREIARRIGPRLIADRLREVLSTDAPRQPFDKPFLVLHGTGDRLVPRRALRAVQRYAPGATIAEIDAPHMLLQTRPREAWTAIVAWASRVHSTPA